MSRRRLIYHWWRTVRDEHMWSGVRLWVEVSRDWKAAKLRHERRDRDRSRARFTLAYPSYNPFVTQAALNQPSADYGQQAFSNYQNQLANLSGLGQHQQSSLNSLAGNMFSQTTLKA